MELDERRIQEIVERVVARVGGGSASGRADAPAASGAPGGRQLPRELAAAPPARGTPEGATAATESALSTTSAGRTPGPAHGPRKPELRIPAARAGLFPDPDSAIRAARQAFERFERSGLELRRRVTAAIREVARSHLRELSEYAQKETGLGRVEDKLGKNLLVIEKTPGPEILAPHACSGDDGLMLTERAAYGVIGAITPCTNPTETILCNGIGMLSGGNAVVFNVHPSAARTSAWLVHLINEAVTSAGGPANLVAAVAEPTIASAQALMRHPGIRLVVVTGGPGVVAEAMKSGKKVIAAGPGNPPILVDETAHLEVAAAGIVKGASLDNNIICVDEKNVIAVAAICDRLKEELARQPVVILSERQVGQLEKAILEKGEINKQFIGKNASVILAAIGVRTGDDCRLVLCEVPEEHPFVQHEQLMPLMPIVRVRDAADGIAAALRIEHGFGHTSSIYSTNIEHMHAMARVVNTSIFVKNAPNCAGLGMGGEGHTSFTIASPTGEGLTTAIHFTRERRCTLKEYFRFV